MTEPPNLERSPGVASSSPRERSRGDERERATQDTPKPKRRRKYKRPLPPRYRWPRGKQPAAARRKCPKCGHLDRAVSSREQITYYGPARCEGCGVVRPLRKVERPVDWTALKARFSIPREFNVA